MDENTFKERSARLADIAKVLEKLPEEVRHDAFQLLKGYVTGQRADESTGKNGHTDATDELEDGSKDAFFAQFDHDKPADNVKLIAAWFYREYGTEAFSIDQLRQESDAVGITIPARPDATLKAARVKGKKMFASAGKGKFKPTVHGEASLRETYSVKKGTKTRPTDDE